MSQIQFSGRAITLPGVYPAPVYAFDIDGVLCHTKEIHRAALEQELGVTLGDGDSWGHFGFHHEDEAVMQRVGELAMDLWRRPTVFANGRAGGREVLRELFARHQLAGYVTRRHPALKDDTQGWLRREGFPVFGFLHHMDGDTDSKARPARNLGATVLVEDAPHEALAAARDGLNVVVVRMLYNRAFELECNSIQRRRAITRDLEQEARRRITFIDTLEELL